MVERVLESALVEGNLAVEEVQSRIASLVGGVVPDREIDRGFPALAFLGRAAAGMPDNPRIHYNYGLLLQQENRIPQARNELEAALALDPEEFDFLFALADHHFRQGNARTALEYADTMIRLYPDNPTAREVRATIAGRGR